MIDLRITNREAIALENLFGILDVLPTILNSPDAPEETKQGLLNSLLADEGVRSAREKLKGELDNMAQAQQKHPGFQCGMRGQTIYRGKVVTPRQAAEIVEQELHRAEDFHAGEGDRP